MRLELPSQHLQHSPNPTFQRDEDKQKRTMSAVNERLAQNGTLLTPMPHEAAAPDATVGQVNAGGSYKCGQGRTHCSTEPLLQLRDRETEQTANARSCTYPSLSIVTQDTLNVIFVPSLGTRASTDTTTTISTTHRVESIAETNKSPSFTKRDRPGDVS